MKFKFFLSALGLLALAKPVMGIVPFDQDADGIPDVWEMVYGFPVATNYPPPASYEPTYDWDEDGDTTFDEGGWGTDPFAITPGSGKSGLSFNRASSGASIIITAKTVPGRHYELLRSLDRTNWTSIASANSGALTSLPLYTINASGTSGRQIYNYKLAVSDIDSDGDGLTDFEEVLLGYNVNGSTDLNGDGIADEVFLLSQNFVSNPINSVSILGPKAATTGKSAGIFSSFSYTANPSTDQATFNSNLWCAGYDFTGSNWQNGTCGTMITRKHMITVNHFTAASYPSFVTLVGKITGKIYTIRLESTNPYVLTGANDDVRILRLVTSDIDDMEAAEHAANPSSPNWHVTIYPMLEARPFDQWLSILRSSNGQVLPDADRPLAIQTEWHNRRAFPVEIKNITFDPIPWIDIARPVSAYDQYFENLNSGDSGHPVFFPMSNGKLALIGLNSQVLTVEPLFWSDLQERIEAAVAADGYHLTLVGPSDL